MGKSLLVIRLTACLIVILLFYPFIQNINSDFSINTKESYSDNEIITDLKQFIPEKNNTNYFIENVGQWNTELDYIGETLFGHVGISRGGFYFNVISNSKKKFDRDIHTYPKEKDHAFLSKGCVIKYTLLNSKDYYSNGIHKTEDKVNSFLGNESSRWKKDVPCYSTVICKDVWDRIDLKLYFSEGNPKYEFIVRPGGDPDDIGIKIEGPQDIKVVKDIITISYGDRIKFFDGPLKVYQEGGSVIESKYDLSNTNILRYHIGNYDPNRVLTIDPLIYSTYIGGTDTDGGKAICIDDDENTYVLGNSRSFNFPITPGVYSTTYEGKNDLVVFSLDSSGSNLLFSTYIGGDGVDWAEDMKRDINGSLYITGYTNSQDYPVSDNAYDDTLNDGTITNNKEDIFVTVLNNNGTDLLSSTFLGGNNQDEGKVLDLDDKNNIYLTGYTASSDFPVTSGAYDRIQNGYVDIFISKFNNNLSSLKYSTFIGGNDWDSGTDLCVISENLTVVCGETSSKGFPTVKGSYDTSFNPVGYPVKNDVFILKLNMTNSKLNFSSFLGGTMAQNAKSLIIDFDSNIIITGTTISNDFPITDIAFDKTYNGDDIFLTKLDSNCSSLLYSTYIGGSNTDMSTDIAINSREEVLITGSVGSSRVDLQACKLEYSIVSPK